MLSAFLALPATYLAAALIGSLVPFNGAWTEPRDGTAIYLADNGIHADLIMPVEANGLNWAKLIRPTGLAAPEGARWIAFGSGEQHIYLDTPSWWDLRPRTIVSAVAGGRRVMHVEYVPDVGYASRQVRLRPEEYRRLWAAVRADFELDRRGRPIRIDHPGYGPWDGFYQAVGKANGIRTCNVVVANWLRLSGVKTSLWPPFVDGLIWRYRRVS